MTLTEKIVNRPVTVFVVFVFIIGLGLYVLSDIAIDLFPEIDPPMLVVFTNYSGAGPEEVEQRVTRPLEGMLSNVGGLKEMTSTSSKGSSMIMLSFGWNADMNEAAADVRDKLEFIKQAMPDAAGTPQIFRFDPSMMPIMNLTVRGNRPPEELLEIVEDQIQPKLEQVDGVSMTSVSGGREKIIEVQISQNRLEAYGLTLTAIAGMIGSQNIQVGGGIIPEGRYEYLVTTSGEFDSVEDVRDTVIAYKGGQGGGMQSGGNLGIVSPAKAIRLKDIADVRESYRDSESTVYINGESGLSISVQKQSGTNSVQVSDRIKERIDEINAVLPTGIELTVLQDTTEIIRASLNQVSDSALYGVLFAMLVLFVFLRNIRSVVIIGLSLPLSLLVTLMAMYFFDLTLNMLTLTGLVLGIGMIVDSSIVILENIYRYREKGAKLKVSAVLGTQEMITAITASTLTTICVFLPIIMFKGQLEMIGVLVQDLAFTVVIALASSLLVAMSVVPVLTSSFLKLYSRHQKPIRFRPLRFLDGLFEGTLHGLDTGYKGAVRFCLQHKVITLLVIVAIAGYTVSRIGDVGLDFMPAGSDDSINLDVSLPEGTRLEVTEELMLQLQSLVSREVNGYEEIIVTSGAGNMLSSGQGNRGSLTVVLPEYEKRIDDSETVKEKLRTHFDQFPGVEFSFSAGQMQMGSATPIDLAIKADDLTAARETALRIKEIIEQSVPEITEPDVSFGEGLPQVEVVIDRDKAYSLGLNVYSVGREINANIEGTTATIFRENGNEYDVVVILDERDRMRVPDLNRIFVMNNMGVRIPVSNFAELKRTEGPVDISREDQTRTVHVTGGLTPGVPLNAAQTKLQQTLESELILDSRVTIDYSGDFQDLQEYGIKFLIIMLIAVALVFGVMAGQFEDFKDPFIIFFSIPLMIVGIVWIYIFTGQTFTIYTAIGLVMLAGIVVNNGIVLVDYTNLLRSRGYALVDACVEAAGNRLRPVLMTSLTTILGMAPMAFMTGEGTDLVQPIGLTVVGGMIASTVLTLFLAPVLYAVFNRRSEKKRLVRLSKECESDIVVTRRDEPGSADAPRSTGTDDSESDDGRVRLEMRRSEA
jgi:hydrophobic/amphiphilic exporter-1 (mainly G- bacteria), HAE1 family